MGSANAIGREARIRGFNIMRAGGMNLTRDPRNGRNFEYYSEDSYHSGVFAAEAINDSQSEGVISTRKCTLYNTATHCAIGFRCRKKTHHLTGCRTRPLMARFACATARDHQLAKTGGAGIQPVGAFPHAVRRL
jgi:hypothetical protein